MTWPIGAVADGPLSPTRLTRPASRGTRVVLFGAVGVAAAVAATAVAIDVAGGRASGDSHVSTTRVMAFVAMAICAIVGMSATVERSRRDVPRRRWPWLALGAGALVQGGGQAVLYLATVNRPGPFEAWVEDIPTLLAAPLFAVSLVALCWPPGLTRSEMLVVISDGALAAAALLIVWQLVILPAEATPDSLVERTFAGIDPWGQWLAIVCVVVLAATSRRSGSLPLPQLVLLQVGVLGFITSDIVGDCLVRADRSSSFSYSVVGYTVAMVPFVALTTRPAIEPESRRVTRFREVWAVVLPAVAVVGGALAVFAYRLFVGPLNPATTGLLAIVVLASIALASSLRLRSDRRLRRARELDVAMPLDHALTEDWFAALVGDSNEIVTMVDRDGVVQFQTPSVTAVLGHDADVARGRPFADLLVHPDPGAVQSLLLRAAHDAADRGPHELVMRDARGGVHDTETRVAPLRTGGMDWFVLTTRDVTDRRRLRAELAESGMRDALTGLLNREGFLARMRELLGSVPSTVEFGVVLADLEGFRDLNDSRGHQAGDTVLRAFAAALDRLGPAALAVARTGGDEFGLVVAGDQVEPEIGEIDRELRRTLGAVLLPDGGSVQLSFALGYVVATGRRLSASDLVERADLAMSAARAGDRGGVVRYDTGMRSALVSRLRAEADLRDALDDGRMVVHYQPVVSLVDGAMVGMEALVRLRGPDGALRPPDTFIPLAESLKLIERLGEQVLSNALRDADVLGAELGRPIPVAVNVSATQLHAGLPATVAEALDRAGRPASALTIELTETMLAGHPDVVGEVLSSLRDMGCKVALDDFGTGYSSLSYLAGLPVDTLKIDRSFVHDLGTSQVSLALVRTVVQLAQTLGLGCVAEGVETVEQADLLRGMGCERAQGFLFSRPMSYDDLSTAIAVTGGVLPLSSR